MTRRFAGVLIAFFVGGCSADVPDATDDPSILPDVAEPSSAPLPSSDFSFASSVTIDLTGDGTPDTLHVTASGDAPLAISVAFNIRSQGRELYTLGWESHEYFRYEPDLAMGADDAPKYDWVQSHLDSILVESNFGSLTPGAQTADPEGRIDPDTDPIRLISGQLNLPHLQDSLTAAGVDSAAIPRTAARLAYERSRLDPRAPGIWEAMADAGLRTFTLYAGGENTRRLAWSRELGQFLTVWSCC